MSDVSYMTLGDRLRDMRIKHGFSQEGLAEELKRVDPSYKFNRETISQLENGIQSSMKDRVLLAACKVFNCRPEWMVYGEEPVASEDNKKLIPNIENVSSDAKLCPVISWVKAGSFTEIELPYSPEEYEYYPCPTQCGNGTYILKVKGDSMEPRFEENDLIFVDPNLIEPVHNKYVIAMLMDSTEATFKQLQIIDGKKYLRAMNPSYPPEMKFLSINGNCQIIGTVVAHVKPL